KELSQQSLSSPLTQTSEGTGINITCSHPKIQINDYIHWYRQLPDRGPAFIVSVFKGSKEVPDPEGRLLVSADRRSSALWLARPRLADAAVYYCAVGTRGVEPGLRPDTNRFGRGGAPWFPGPQGAMRHLRLGPPELTVLTWRMSLAMLGILWNKAFQLHTSMSAACRGHKHLPVVPTVSLSSDYEIV
uniref:Ig-like domain-containing protein n=1 Tax=Coturnix japonica TaxID=93934 RepID=A0A8C2UBD7_COTJA